MRLSMRFTMNTRRFITTIFLKFIVLELESSLYGVTNDGAGFLLLLLHFDEYTRDGCIISSVYLKKQAPDQTSTLRIRQSKSRNSITSNYSRAVARTLDAM